MEKIPEFIKKFSKENDPDGRQETAEKILDIRRKNREKEAAELEKQRELASPEYQEKVAAEVERMESEARQLESIKKLSKEIQKIDSKSTFDKLLNYFKLKSIHNELALKKAEYSKNIPVGGGSIEKAETFDKQEIPEEFEEPQKILANFYEEQKEKWANSDFTKEDIVEHFSEKNLASLSLEDYEVLLKRFPGAMVTHVTRQGVRDHVGHFYHNEGLGEFSNGFTRMLNDGHLRSPFGIFLAENEKEKAVAKFLNLEDFETKDEAMQHLENAGGEKKDGSGWYADRSAIHFATEEVASAYYGAEKNNEVFVAFPSAFIASNYYFHGQLNANEGGEMNDQSVYTKEQVGMDLDAGIVFIPKNTMVNPETGSRYELDENKKPTKNEEYVSLIKKFVYSGEFESFTKQLEGLKTIKSPAEKEGVLKKLRAELEKFNIDKENLQDFIINIDNAESILTKKNITTKESGRTKAETNDTDPIIQIVGWLLKKDGILYKETENAIASKEFWEAHFSKNPEKRPSKIVYYEENSPSEALIKWKERAGITKTTSDRNIGFPENRVFFQSPQATEGFSEFDALARNVIDNHFAEKGALV